MTFPENEVQHLGEMLEAIDDVVWIATPDGKILYVNQAVQEVYGYSVTEFITTSSLWVEVIHPDDQDIGLQSVNSLMQHGQTEVEYRIIQPNGEVRWILDRKNAIYDQSGQLLRIGGIASDITAQKQAEAKLTQYSEQLEERVEIRTKSLQEAHAQLVRQEKLAVLGQLAAGVAHELRNPLSVIANSVYFLRMILTNAEEQVLEYLNILDTRVKEAEKIISALLNFTRTHPTEPTENDLSLLITQVLREYPPPGNVIVAKTIPPDIPPVFIDCRQISQVLVHLVTNAYQAMPDGGDLSLNTQMIEGHIQLALTDTGQGISSEAISKIFDPLFSTKIHGIGLGLAVVKNLVEINGGRIAVESIPGQGSTFMVTLPTYERIADP